MELLHEVISDIVDNINNRITKENKRLLVHSAEGKSRTGTILATYLMKKIRFLTRMKLLKLDPFEQDQFSLRLKKSYIL